MAAVCPEPTLMRLNLSPPATAVGVETSSPDPFPSRPNAPCPQQYAAPDGVSAQEYSLPEAI